MWDTLWGAEQLFVPHRATISTTRAVQLYGPEAAGGPVMHDTASCGLLHHRTTKGPEIVPQSLTGPVQNFAQLIMQMCS